MARKRKADEGSSSPRDPNPSKAKARKEEALTISSTLFGCSDIVSEVFSFLDTRSLLQFSIVNKQYPSLLTYHHVVRSAMMTGGKTSESLERMIAPIRDQTIWIPSPQRLLRVVSGKRCEKCCGTTRHVAPCIGLFFCYNCKVKNTEELWRSFFFDHSARIKLAPRKEGPTSPKKFLIMAPMKDVTGENIGPVVTYQDFRKIMKISDWGADRTSVRKAVAGHLQECDTRQPHASQARTAILSTFNESQSDATARKEAMVKAKLARRKKRMDELLVQLKALIGDDVSWKSSLDNRTWKSSPWGGDYYSFRDPMMKEILEPMLRAPSKITKKKLREIPGKIQSLVDKRALTDQYIQRIKDSVDFRHPDLVEHFLRRKWCNFRFHYYFSEQPIDAILKKPLKNPYSLKEEDLLKLCNQVKSVLNREDAGIAVLRKLAEKLKGMPFKKDVERYRWDNLQWAYRFHRDYIQRILSEPLLKPEDITESKLSYLAKRVCKGWKMKQYATRRVKLLIGPTRKYTAWNHRLRRWGWVGNKIVFYDFEARYLLNDDFADLKTLTDERIAELSKEVIAVFGKKYGNSAV